MHIESASFSGHESFPLRQTWLTKGVMACAENPSIFGREDAMVDLGVGKNMVQSIRHWCLSTQVIQEDASVKNNRGRHLDPTEIGQRIFLTVGGWDPYLEDVATLWLLHWLLLTNGTRATTWFLAFNNVHQPEFTRKTLEDVVANYARRFPNTRASDGTIRRDVDVFIRTYVGGRPSSTLTYEDTLECPFNELGLIYEQSTSTGKSYSFVRGPKDTLPDAVLVYALSDYFRRQPDRRSVFTFDELAYGPLGPGRAFKLDDTSLGERLDRLAQTTAGAWQFSETAGLKEVVLTGNIDALQILNDYYLRSRTHSIGAGQ